MVELVCHDIAVLSGAPAQGSVGRGRAGAAGSHGSLPGRRLGAGLEALDDVDYPTYTFPPDQVSCRMGLPVTLASLFPCPCVSHSELCGVGGMYVCTCGDGGKKERDRDR
jgi:hypothetical protein